MVRRKRTPVAARGEAALTTAAAVARLVGLVGGVVGCTAARVTDPERTATEQFLLSQAAVEAVARLSFDPLRGRRVWVDDRYFAAADAPFVLGQVRAKMLIDGLRLVENREEAQVVLEVRSGGVGIDRGGFLLGIPPIVGYELSVLRNLEQHGVAEVAYVAYWRESGEMVAASGPFMGRSMRDDWWYLGLGPWSRGDIPPVQEEEASAEPGELVEESPLTGSDEGDGQDEEGGADADRGGGDAESRAGA
jgi:hypothetical protein